MTAPQITIHDVTGVTVTNVMHSTLPCGDEYYTRRLTVTGIDGTIFTIQLFADDGYALLVHDDDLKSQ